MTTELTMIPVAEQQHGARGTEGAPTRWRFPLVGAGRSQKPSRRRIERPAESANRDKDVAKLHSEVLQIVSQRFQLTTGAIVFFTAACGWMAGAAGGAGRPPGSALVVRFVAALVGLVLTLTYAYSASLNVTLRWLTTYLMCAGSDWEYDWYRFREWMAEGRPIPPAGRSGLRARMPFKAYTSASTYVFVALLLCTYAYWYVLEYFAFLHKDVRVAAVGAMPLAVALGAIAALAREIDRGDIECTMVEVWQTVCRSEPAGPSDEIGRDGTRPPQSSACTPGV